jgi:hypothetical protein
MPTLERLGLVGGGRAMLIAPPDDVLAEAARLSPRPSVASTLLVAEPEPVMVWWLNEVAAAAPALLERFRWMIGASGEARAWIVIDADEADSPPLDDLRTALEQAGMTVVEEVALDANGLALRVRPVPK